MINKSNNKKPQISKRAHKTQALRIDVLNKYGVSRKDYQTILLITDSTEFLKIQKSILMKKYGMLKIDLQRLIIGTASLLKMIHEK